MRRNQLLRASRKGYSIKWCWGFNTTCFRELARTKQALRRIISCRKEV